MIVAELRYCVASVTGVAGVQRQPSKLNGIVRFF